MSWIVLVASGFLEAVWATALARSDGLTRLVPAIVFLVASAASFVGLAWALREIPLGTGYAVWTGIGAATTATWAMVTGAEPATVLRVVFLVGIIGCIVGLKVTS